MRMSKEKGWKQRLLIMKEAVSTGIGKFNTATEKEKLVYQHQLRIVLSRFNDEVRSSINNLNEQEVQEFTLLQLEGDVLSATPLKTPPLPPSQVNQNQPKLPKLELSKFKGDPIKWTEFNDRFLGSVDQQPISDSLKLTYLQASLEGEALASIRGLDNTNDNYPIAMNILKERYGKPGIVLNAHYTALMHLKKTSSHGKECLETYHEIERHLRILKSMGENTDHNTLKTMILSKFPDDIIYELRKKIRTEDETLEQIRKELEQLINAKLSIQPQPSTTIETLHVRERNSKAINFKKKEIRKRQSSTQVFHLNEKKRKMLPCIFCGKWGHFNSECKNVVSIQERKNKLKGKCYICFKNHPAKNCTNKKPCFHCKGAHNAAICPRTGNQPYQQKTMSMFTSSQKQESKSITLLQTAVYRINGYPVRILFDSGSQRSYLTEKVFKNLNLEIIEDTVLTIYTFGTEQSQEIYSPTTEVSMKGIKIRVNIVPFITEEVECAKEVISCEDRYEGLTLADDGSLGNRVDMLIGNDYYYSFVHTHRKKIKEHLFLINSAFGWIWSGIYKEEGEKENGHIVLMTYTIDKTTHCKEIDLPLRENTPQKLWDLETIGITDCPKASRDDQAVESFNKSVQFVQNRYWIKWPWTEYPPDLPLNYSLAKGRLVGLARRLDRAALARYDATIKDQLRTGIIEITYPPDNIKKHPIHYLPHHTVKHIGKKDRIVFDGSSKTKGNKSLNDCMYKGPLLLEDLVALLLRFRTRKYGIMADIEKAFLQLGIQEDDRDVTRFLWLKNIEQSVTNDDNLIHLRFCRVPFGVVSSPFLLAIVLQHHFLKIGTETSKLVARDIYVDNIMTGKDTLPDCVKFYEEVRAIFNNISMNIREWYSNNSAFMEKIDKKLRGKETEITNSLGLNWKLSNDTLYLNLKREYKEGKVTKREVLKQLASVYDPCGFGTPLLLKAKLFLQQLWKGKYDWDVLVPDNLQKEWEEIKRDLEGTKDIAIPRWYGVSQPLDSEYSEQELHVFADASTEAYAAVVYLKIKQHNETKVNIVMSKSRLTPLKDKLTHTIPRLELMAVLIASRLLNYVKKALNINIKAEYIWSDSQVVLHWLNSSRVLPPFVNNRVQEIKKNKNVIIRYVPSKHNPADMATRPCANLSNEKIWIHGPEFLKDNQTKWPENNLDHSSVLLCNFQTNLNSDEYEDIKSLQKKHFLEELQGKETNLSRSLGLFLDKDLLRCRGRFKNTNWAVEQKYPILLPKNEEFTRNIIMKTHKKLHHVGAAQTLAQIRLTYWIPQGRSVVQKVLKQCAPCIKYGGGPYNIPPAPDLPEERITLNYPWTYVGLDYLGPLYIEKGNEVSGTKRWICLFTCMVVRAVHLEVVADLSAEECLLALRRFVATRRIPKKIISDNATNFKLTAEILQDDFCKENNIEWKFIPQLAPWFGGAYERLVGLVKHSMKRTIDKHLLTENQLTTLTKEIESVINCRPLTSITADLEHTLTPADFLVAGGLLTVADEGEESTGTSTKRNLVEGWKQGQKILKEITEMFQNQYLASLRERSLRHKSTRGAINRIPKVGDIVQIKDHLLTRVKWNVGKIDNLVYSKDGLIRVAIVKMDNGEILRRAIAHLYPLEVDLEGGDNENMVNMNLEGGDDIENIIDKNPKGEKIIINSQKEKQGSTKKILRQGSKDLGKALDKDHNGIKALGQKLEKANIEKEKERKDKKGSIGIKEYEAFTRDGEVEVVEEVMVTEGQEKMSEESTIKRKPRKAAVEAKIKMDNWLKALLLKIN